MEFIKQMMNNKCLQQLLKEIIKFNYKYNKKLGE